MYLGIVNELACSSSGQLSTMPCVTFTDVSCPTKSPKRNVPVLGRPMSGPVNLSTSSIVKPISVVSCWIFAIAYTPTRFAMKAGVSLASTVRLPRNLSPYSMKKSTTAGSVFSVGMTSNKRK